jgi:hypothetical protein
MIALLLAAAVAGQAPPPMVGARTPHEVAPVPMSEPMPNAYRQAAYCPSIVEQEAHRQAVAMHGRPPGAQYAVLRQLDGCSVPTPIGYHPDYLLPGAADPQPKPEGAPANRR